jgi:transposase, IS5 family
MAGIAIFAQMHNFSGGRLGERWSENPYYQLFCGAEFLQHRSPFDRSSMRRFRERKDEGQLVALLQERVSTRRYTRAAKRRATQGAVSS